MANNKTKTIGLAFCLALFFVGGWLLGRVGHNSSSEVEQLYTADGESVGIFNQIPPEDMAAAEAVANASLQEDIVLPEDKKIVREDGKDLPSQIALTDVADIAGVAPKEDPFAEESSKKPVDLQLTGEEVASVVPQTIPAATADLEDSQITLIAAPVKYYTIQNATEYKAFKNKARGNYPQVDFAKQMLIVLESDSNLPDNVFELIAAQPQQDALKVTYRVNVFRLDKKVNSHTVLAVDKTQAPIQLEQVL